MFASIRLFAGIVALAGLSLALTEGVLAASCPPATIGTPVVGEVSHGMPAGFECAPRHHGGDHDHDHDPSCPFAPLASPDGCVGAASLPAVAVCDLMFSPEISESIGSSPTQAELLLASALFRPPRP